VALFRRIGVEPEPFPSFEILRRVNGRAFCAELGQNLMGSLFARSVEEATAAIAQAPPVGRQWRAKRAFGMAGRGQRTIAAGRVSEADRAFLRASVERDGGIQIEPEVDIVRELSIHGLLTARGELTLGPALEQHCDATGQWLASTPLASSPLAPLASTPLASHADAATLGAEADRILDDVTARALASYADAATLDAALRAEATRVAAALHAAGYFGPFGVDAYEYRAGDAIRLNPRSEINARYSMGFAASGLRAEEEEEE
jgi:hypothetical protein